MSDQAQSSSPLSPEQQPLRTIEIIALLAILIPVVLRTIVSIDPFPFWSANPLESWVGLTGLSPAHILICDCLTLVASGMLIWLLTCRGILMQAWQVAPAIPAIAISAWWGMRNGGSVDHLAVGMPWAAGVASAIAASSAMRIDQARRVLTGVLIGICAMLALKAMVQVGIEHPTLVRDFKANRQAIFAANGWTPDSSMARAYERRVMQSEATGWFGLANPFATIGAAVTVFGCALLVPIAREKVRAGLGVFIAILGAVIIALAGAKGGYVAAAVGGAVLVVAWTCARPKVSAKKTLSGFAILLTGLAAIALPLLMVAARGIAGERLGELSIWFRAMYLQAAARIFADHPWVGVGPAGFKDAYLLSKNPLNPEEVASPHSVIADFAAGLGISGLLVGVLIVFFALMAASRAVTAAQSVSLAESNEEQANDDQEGTDRRLIAVSLVTPVLIAAYVERDMATIENLLVRVLGLAIAVILAVSISGISSRRVALGLAGAALAALAHAQIEMTPILTGSSGWFWLLVGMGGAATASSAGTCRLGKTWSIIGCFATLLVGGFVAVAAVPGVLRWNAALKDAALEVRPLAEVKALLQQGSRDPIAMKEALAVLSAATGKPVAGDSASIQSAIATMLESGTDRASRALMRARNEGSGHYGTARAYSQLLMFRADLALQRGDRPAATELANLAIAAVEDQTVTTNAARWGWIGTLRIEQAKRGFDPAALEQADQAFQSSRTLDPWSLNPLLRQIEVVKNSGQNSRAADLAKIALELNHWSRLDPLKGLTPSQKAELERLAASIDTPPSPNSGADSGK